jgi:hypothetical protein
MTGDILDPSAILALLPSLLPPSAKELGNGSDAIAVLVHSAMSAVGFRLIAVDDTSPAQHTAVNVLPEVWKANSPGHYTFRYRHDQSSLEYLVKISKLGNRTMINAIAVEAGPTVPFFRLLTKIDCLRATKPHHLTYLRMILFLLPFIRMSAAHLAHSLWSTASYPATALLT